MKVDWINLFRILELFHRLTLFLANIGYSVVINYRESFTIVLLIVLSFNVECKRTQSYADSENKATPKADHLDGMTNRFMLIFERK